MAFPKATYIDHDGLKLALYEAGPVDGPPLILIHGWPELAYSWANQIGPLSDAGYRVIALDLRGFGRSSAPRDSGHYGIANIVSDVEAVLNARDVRDCVIVGHDWGGIIVWHAARMLADRVKGVIGICTPHVKPAPVDPMKIFRKRYGDEHYFVHFKDRPGQADALFMQDPESFFRLMFRKTPKGSTFTGEWTHIPKRFANYLEDGSPDLGGYVMSDKDLKTYASLYSQSGFHGGLNLYRNTTENWELAKGLSTTIPQPVLMISAREDLFLPPELTDGMIDMVPDLERHTLEDCGHWVMWEQPDRLNALMLEWLGRRYK